MLLQKIPYRLHIGSFVDRRQYPVCEVFAVAVRRQPSIRTELWLLDSHSGL